MGLSSKVLSICDFISNDIRGREVISLGNPFPSIEELRRSNLSEVFVSQILRQELDHQAKYIFEELYKVNRFEVVDISEEESADYIADLNDLDFTNNHKKKYDLLLDLGTQEHVFNNNNFLQNVFNLLKPGGIYIFEVPCTGYIDHGFRQYSPTFFFDLCVANPNSLKLEYLSVHDSDLNIDLLPVYKKLDPNFETICSPIGSNKSRLSINLGSATGTAINMINISGKYFDLLGVIRKSEDIELSFKVTQCIYRNYSLKKILPDKNRAYKKNKSNIKNFIKSILIYFPLPINLKIACINMFLCMYRKLK